MAKVYKINTDGYLGPVLHRAQTETHI